MRKALYSGSLFIILNEGKIIRKCRGMCAFLYSLFIFLLFFHIISIKIQNSLNKIKNLFKKKQINKTQTEEKHLLKKYRYKISRSVLYD